MAYSSNGCNKVEELPKVAGDYVQRKSGNIFDMMQERNVTTDHALNVLAKLFYFTARRYASAVYAVVACPSVRPSVCLSQASIVSNDRNTVLCPQNGDRIVNIDYVTSLHPMYIINVNYDDSTFTFRLSLTYIPVSYTHLTLPTTPYV